MLNLFVVSVRHLDRLVMGMLDGLVISYGLCYINRVSDSCMVGVNVLSFIRDLFVRDNWFVICVGLLNWYMFYPCLRLRCAMGCGYSLISHNGVR